jgi:hypothetical protein
MGFNGYVDIVKTDDLTSDDSSPKFSLGAKHARDGNEFVYVHVAKAATTGKYTVLEINGTSITSGYTVTVSNASQSGYLAGVPQSSISSGNYGWVMSKGVSLIAVDSGEVSAAPGVELQLGTNGGFVAAGATFSTAPRFGVTINSFVTTVGTSKARIFGSIL